MGLRTEVQIKVDGTYVKGSVIGKSYKTNQLVNVYGNKNQYASYELKKIIAELQELADLMDGVEVTDKLADTNAGVQTSEDDISEDWNF
jgi:hypothetical protein